MTVQVIRASIQRRRFQVPSVSSPRLIVAYLLAITIAETVTTFFSAPLGVVLHTLILFTLIISAVLFARTSSFELLISLMIAPIIRLLSLALPLFVLDQKYWYLVVSIPLFFAAFIMMRVLNYSFRQIGFNLNRLKWQLGIFLLGIVFGAIEYAILHPKPLIPNALPGELIRGTVILFLGTGLIEEFIFRGIIQTAAEKMLGPTGSMLFTATIFMVLHIGWQSAIDMVFVFVAGFSWSYVAWKTRSILGVTFSHTIANVMLFIVLPLLIPVAAGVTNIAPTNSHQVIGTPMGQTLNPVGTPVAGIVINNPESSLPEQATASEHPTVGVMTSGLEEANGGSNSLLTLTLIEIYILLIAGTFALRVPKRRK